MRQSHTFRPQARTKTGRGTEPGTPSMASSTESTKKVPGRPASPGRPTRSRDDFQRIAADAAFRHPALELGAGKPASCDAICVANGRSPRDRLPTLVPNQASARATAVAAAASRAKVRVRRTQASLVGDRGADGEMISQLRRLGNADHAPVGIEIGCDRDIGFLRRIQARVFFDQTGERARILHVGADRPAPAPPPRSRRRARSACAPPRQDDGARPRTKPSRR